MSYQFKIKISNKFCEITKLFSVTAGNQKNIKCQLDIKYGESDREAIDLYGTDLPKNSPLFVFVHGGYWQLLSKNMSGYPVKPFVEAGIQVMILDYDLCPQVSIEGQIEQIKKAGKFIFNYCKENGIEKLSIAGHSVGAHLISYMLEKDYVDSIENFGVLKSLYLLGGVYDVKKIRHVKGVNPDNVLQITDENEDYLSPVYHDFSNMANHTLAYHVYVAEFDPPIFIQHSQDFYKKLAETLLKNVDFEIYNGFDHFDFAENLADPDYKLTKMLIHDLKN